MGNGRIDISYQVSHCPKSLSFAENLQAKYLLRGGKRGDKSPLVRDFQKIWVEKLGPEKYKDTVKELKQKRWIGISRDPSRRGRKAGKAVIYLIDRDCASKYIKYCQDKEVSDSELHHHSEHHSYLERKY